MNNPSEDAGYSAMPDVHNGTGDFILVWLYTGTDLEMNSELHMNLQFTIDSVRTFDQHETCLEYIRSVKYKQIILVVTIKIAAVIIPDLHELRQLDLIYIYNLSDSDPSNEQWTYCYKKVGRHTILLVVI